MAAASTSGRNRRRRGDVRGHPAKTDHDSGWPVRRRVSGLAPAALVSLAFALGFLPAPQVDEPLGRIGHIIVIYEENHSFDNYFGRFPGADGIANAGAAAIQVDKQGEPYATLPPPLADAPA